ncbi:ankyrin repeat domain-containing protein [Sphingomonas nostoxanthinifaciens]|uniref:ankyrin repeat domain-containing protein n=1 Tax=Sphingomonas nostoxanthinifaciens TaxID=2872652 RepID=UPI001CC20D9F|nr:ankyrin repeat domain-containing protein [Sphingomonas nostoxanthinifaciens]
MADVPDPAELPPLPPMERMIELLFDAARQGRDDVIPALLRAGVDIEACDARGYTPLVIASYNGQESTTELLLQEGASPDGAVDAQGNSALMGVAFKGHVAIARRLIAAGAQVDRRNGVGQTALMTAALFGRTDIVELLLAAGADASLIDAAGNSAASLARMQGNDAMAQLVSAERG